MTQTNSHIEQNAEGRTTVSQQKEGYKLTKLGLIPDDWEVRKVSELARLINGKAFKPEDWKKSGLPIIRIQNLKLYL